MRELSWNFLTGSTVGRRLSLTSSRRRPEVVLGDVAAGGNVYIQFGGGSFGAPVQNLGPPDRLTIASSPSVVVFVHTQR